MAPPPLFNMALLDEEHTAYDRDAIERVNPHRGCMGMLDRIIYEDYQPAHYAAVRDIHDDEFWVHGHIPGRPLFPGVLMIEAAAQLASFACLLRLEGQSFMGFTGAQDVKFRETVVPGDRLLILVEQIELRPRRSVSRSQGWVGSKLAFEATIIGMPM